MGAVRRSFPGEPGDHDDLMGASLDHAIWFHRPARADEWVLIDMDGHGMIGCRGLATGLVRGTPGETYVIGGKCEMKNIDVVRALIETVQELAPETAGKSVDEMITYVTDRPGHDHRYAIDPARISRELGWEPQEDFKSGLRKTVQWYLDNAGWVDAIESGRYQGERLGVRI